jgi:hypothetical protein
LKHGNRVWRWRVWRYDPDAIDRLFKGGAAGGSPAASSVILAPSAPSILGAEENREGLGPAAEPRPYPTLVRNDHASPVLVVIVGTAFTPAVDERSTSECAKMIRKRGRPASEETQALYKFCYEGYIAGEKRGNIRRNAITLFGEELAPKEDKHVTAYAQRYAEKHHLPLNRPAPQ